MRWMKRPLIGSLAAPRRSASRATSSGTPSISNMIRPGLTLAAQNSGAPLPLPIRTSVGFDDTGTSGKMRIHTRPARFMARVMARRAASIWRALTRSGSRALRPNWPKLRSVPPLAVPWMRPLNCLRNLVFLGCSIAASSHLSRLRRLALAFAIAAAARAGAFLVHLLVLRHRIVLEDLAFED